MRYLQNPGHSLPHTHANRLMTGALLVAMLLLAMVPGYLFAGSTGAIMAVIGMVISFSLVSNVAGPLMAPRGSHLLSPRAAPQLYRMVTQLAERAELSRTPGLIYVPDGAVNAFATSHRGEAVIGVTDGALHKLSPRELTGVLAHEVAHIAAGDTTLLGIAQVFTMVTRTMSQVGLLLALFAIPAVLIGEQNPSWLIAVLILTFSPAASLLLQLALSRTREYEADARAIQLTGDPQGLASALNRLGATERWFRRIGRLPGIHPWMRSHPDTEDRIQRLLQQPAKRPDDLPLNQVAVRSRNTRQSRKHHYDSRTLRLFADDAIAFA
ncbi:MAG: zinc metalloprotease HtpX [Pseudomonadota bacterium]